MILYVNGDSHSAGAEAVNSYCFAEDDPLYRALGRIPHPDNERASYGCLIANELGAILHCDAESASSNARIIRTTRDYLANEGRPDAVIIGWSTWEREEWLLDNRYWQVNAGGVGHDWPEEIKERYKKYIVQIDWDRYERAAHDEIFAFHNELTNLEIPHLFFNCYSDFQNQVMQDWNNCYVEPYDPDMTYWQWLTNNGFESNQSYHFRADAHRKWAEFLLPHLTRLL
jgi:hypothetical protein